MLARASGVRLPGRRWPPARDARSRGLHCRIASCPDARPLGAGTRRRRWLALVSGLLLGACSTHPSLAPAPWPHRDLVLFGEVHDNAAGHALRVRVLDGWLAAGWRPAIAMEMFDRGDQPAIDAALANPPGRGAQAFIDAVIAARDPASRRSGWDWALYRPLIERALHLGLPIVAANVGRAEGREIMRDGLAAHGFDAAVPPDILEGHAQEIVDGHCGHLDEPTARRMALVQAARDQQMARALTAHAGRGVLLVAGNGHVRSDLGVPRWLSPALRARSEAVGVLEAPPALTAFDRLLTVPAQPRKDPCEAMRLPAR